MAKKVTRAVTVHTIEVVAVDGDTCEFVPKFTVTLNDNKNIDKAFNKLMAEKYPNYKVIKYDVVNTETAIYAITEEQFMEKAVKVKVITPVEAEAENEG